MIGKMYTSFTSKSIIDHCIKENFANNSIQHIKHVKNIQLQPNEIVIEIKDKNVYLVDQHKVIDNLRLQFFTNLLKYPLSKLNNISCKVIINLCDGCRYSEKYTRLCFSASKSSKHIQIPDPHIFQYEKFNDNIEWKDKLDIIYFIGSDTGRLDDDLLNERVRFCNKAKSTQHIHAKISNFVHFNDEMLHDLSIDKNSISSQYVPIDQQLNHKYILNINGNTASWDRIPWAMMSNSYLIHLASDFDEYNWYFPFIQETNAIDTYSADDLLNNSINYNSNKKKLQKDIASILLSHSTQLDYFTQVLINYNRIYNS